MQTNNKLREALMQIYERVNSLDENCAVDPVEIRDIAKAALAAPVKNCEVGTAEEQYTRFIDMCTLRSCTSCPYKAYEGCGRDSCLSNWAQMPYEEGGAK